MTHTWGSLAQTDSNRQTDSRLRGRAAPRDIELVDAAPGVRHVVIGLEAHAAQPVVVEREVEHVADAVAREEQAGERQVLLAAADQRVAETAVAIRHRVLLRGLETRRELQLDE